VSRTEQAEKISEPPCGMATGSHVFSPEWQAMTNRRKNPMQVSVIPSLIPLVFCALLASASAGTYAACNGDCTEGSNLGEGHVAPATRKSDRPAQAKEQAVVALNLRESSATGKAGPGDAAGALVLRTDSGRNARAEIRPARLERSTLDPLAPSKPPAWVLLLAGLAFAVIVVRKRSGG
jgi:hypothetical protein